MDIKFFIFLLAISSLVSEAFAQENIESQIESIGEGAELENLEIEEFENYNYLSHPLNLNKATKEDLYKLKLNKFQAVNLVNHIYQNGPLLSLQELQAIEGFDLFTIQRIFPFIKIENEIFTNLKASNLIEDGNHQLLTRYDRILEKQKGYSQMPDSTHAMNPESKFLGNPMKLLFRYKFSYKEIIGFGLSGEKDPGEEFFRGTQKNGFDFYSSYLCLKNQRFVKSLIIGDYQLQFGQGLIIGSGFGLKKSSDVTNLTQPLQGISPYSSSDENSFMRGAGTTLQMKKFEISVFYSRKRTDADTLFKPLNTEIAINSFYTSGLHRTPNELAKKNSVHESIYGLNSRFVSRKADFGITVLKLSYDAILKKSYSTYSQFNGSKQSGMNASADYNIIYKNIYLFGEIGIDQNKTLAFLDGIQIYLDRQLTFSFMYRFYPVSFTSPLGNSFSESTKNMNETGVYSAIELKPTQRFSVGLYYDLFRFPWLKYKVDAPSKGTDVHLQFNYTFSNKTALYFRIRKKSKEQNSADAKGVNSVSAIEQLNYRFDISYPVSNNLRLKNRIEFVEIKTFEYGSKKGFLIYQDLIYNPLSLPLDLTCRYSLFDTDDYGSRIYAYENDVQYAYSIPANFYKGARVYGILHFKIIKTVDLWMRYSQTMLTNKKIISSGLTEIAGNKKSEIKIQLMVRF